MGVLGLWNLLEPVGKPVPVETLENKVLAVDISIWLNQAVKGFRDRTGNAVPHAHLLGLYHRVCKLLFYRIKPVFVFDGQPPQLKRDTLIRRRMRKSKDTRKAKAASAKILDNYLRSQVISQKLQRQTHAIEKINKHGTEAISNLLNKRTTAREKDLFELPALPEGEKINTSELLSSDDSESETEEILENLGVDTTDIYNLDVKSDKFKSLPSHLQYDVLSEMREKRKQNSWARIHTMPEKAENFSSFQLERLKHRRSIQKTLDNVKDDLQAAPEDTFSEGLFVGDIGGLKGLRKEMKKMDSNPGSAVLYVSGIQEAKRKEKQKMVSLEEEDSPEKMKSAEIREFPDFSGVPETEEEQLAKALAMSLEENEGPSQSEIFSMIKQEYPGSSSSATPAASVSKLSAARTASSSRSSKRSSIVKQEVLTVDDDDDIVLLPDASFITSNRFGGQLNFKKEIKEEIIDPEDVSAAASNIETRPKIKEEILDSDEEGVIGMDIDTETKKDNKAKSNNLFSDVFQTKEDTTALLDIFEKAGKQKEDNSQIEIMSGSSDSEDFEDVGVMSGNESSSEEDAGQDKAKPVQEPEDDLFSDVFANPKDVKKLDTLLKEVNPKDNVEVMSESDDSSSEDGNTNIEVSKSTKSNNDDLFSDIFNNTENVKKVDNVLAKSNDKTSDAQFILDKVSKLDKPGDIFSEISRSNRQKNVTKDNGPAKEKDSKTAERVAEAMKSSGQLWMKVVSKYAEEAVTKSPGKRGLENKDSPNKKLKIDDPLMEEQQKLVKEMQEKEKASRLLQFTQIQYQPDRDEEEFSDDEEISDRELQNLGIQSMSTDSYNKQILKDEGLLQPKNNVKKSQQNVKSTKQKTAGSTEFRKPEAVPVTESRKEDKQTKPAEPEIDESEKMNEDDGDENGVESRAADDVIYAAAAPGFTRSSKDTLPVIDVSNNPTAPSRVSGSVGEDSDADPDEPGEPGEEGVDEAELYAIQAQLAKENSSLVAEMNKADRIANSITDQMYSECQELLQLFGIPWIVSPTEAEAQCAWLDEAGLTHGTITDDSDIWLFGGKKVYKNFFNQEKYVEMFNYEEISHHFGLNREKLILLAMLTGSDYTEGIEGVGPVTALEVLAEFPGDGLDPLIEFKKWWERVRMEYGKDYGMPVGNKVREKLRKYKLSVGFPNEAIMKAYVHPTIDESRERFSWAVPNLVAVRDFAQERFGWAKFQVDEILTPVIRSLQKSSSQERIDSYFTSYRVNLPDKGLQSSKRVEEALRKVKGIPSPTKPSPKKFSRPEISKTKPGAKSTSDAATKGKKGKKQTKKTQNVEEASSSQPAPSTSESSSQPALSTSESSSQPAPSTSEAAENVSLIARSSGFVLSASPDDVILQREERERKAKEVKARAAEIFRKSEEARKRKHAKRFKRPARVELAKHNLSSDED